MMKLLGIVVLAGLIGSVQAAPIDCSTVTTFQNLLDANNNADPGCQSQDKIFTNWAGTVPGTTPVSIFFVLGATSEQHAVSFGDLAAGTSYNLSYVIAIEPIPANDGTWITQVALDTDAPAGSGAAFKAIYEWNGAPGALLDTLVSNNGVPDASIALRHKSLLINEQFTVNTSAYSSSTNVFFQSLETPPSNIPEPATYALIGSGLIGLVCFSRRKPRQS